MDELFVGAPLLRYFLLCSNLVSICVLKPFGWFVDFVLRSMIWGMNVLCVLHNVWNIWTFVGWKQLAILGGGWVLVGFMSF